MVDGIFDAIEKVVDIVDQAVNSQDYSTMNRDIGNLFNQKTGTGTGQQGPNAGSGTGPRPGQNRGPNAGNPRPNHNGYPGRPRYQPYEVPGRRKVNSTNGGYYAGRAPRSAGPAVNRTAGPVTAAGSRKSPFFSRPSGVGPGFMTALGAVGSFSFFGLALPLLTSGIGAAVGAGIFFGILGGLSAGVMSWGISSLRRIKRTDRYYALLSDKKYADVEDLASCVNRTEKFVVGELRSLTGKKVFPQGHFDAGRKTFMITDELYQQYKAVTAQTKALKKVQKEQEKAFNDLQPEVREMIVKGNDYVRKIHEANDDIADPVVTEKLNRMEAIVAKIFAEVRERPQQAGRLSMLMDYYLPTTSKLIDAYRDMIHQPIQSDNLTSAEREIENSLDTINDAFEKLLDSFYADAAMDLSTDISVMKTMMKRQGLTNEDFKTAGPELRAEGPRMETAAAEKAAENEGLLQAGGQR